MIVVRGRTMHSSGKTLAGVCLLAVALAVPDAAPAQEAGSTTVPLPTAPPAVCEMEGPNWRVVPDQSLVQYDMAAAAQERLDNRAALDRILRPDRNKDEETLGDLLLALNDEVGKLRQAWLTAHSEADKLRQQADATCERIRRHFQIQKMLGDRLKLPAQDPVIVEEQKVYAKEVTAAKDKEKTVEPLYTRYDREAKRLTAYLGAAPGAAETLAGSGTRKPSKPTRLPKKPPDALACSIDTPEERRDLKPNECAWLAQDLSRYDSPAGRGLSQGSVTLPDRPLDRRGVTAQLTSSGDKTSISLKLADTINFRRFSTEGPFWQRNWNIGFSLGVTADVADSKGRIAELGAQSEEDNLSALDRLDERVKATGSISLNWYDRERGKDWQRRGSKMQALAQVACRTDQAKSPPAFPSTCRGDQLLAWIFAQKEDGSYANPDQVKAFNDVYWGPADKVARGGFGVSVDVAQPSFSYFPFTMVEVPNPLRPGETMKVIDTSNLPQSFLDDDPIRTRHWSYTISPYFFYRIPYAHAPHLGTTIIGSATYKHNYKKRTEITICPAGPVGAPVVTSELCRKAFSTDGVVEEGWVPSIELREQYRGFGWGRGLIPELGFAPKFAWDRPAKRYSLDFPVWMTLDDKGALSGGLSISHHWGRGTGSEPQKPETGVYIFVGTTFSLGAK